MSLDRVCSCTVIATVASASSLGFIRVSVSKSKQTNCHLQWLHSLTVKKVRLMVVRIRTMIRLDLGVRQNLNLVPTKLAADTTYIALEKTASIITLT